MPVPPDLLALYQSAHYHALTPGGTVARTVRVGERHRDWLESLDAHSATFVTAWNPMGETLADDVNEAAQRRLAQWLHAHGLHWTPARGDAADGSFRERGACVFDASHDEVESMLVDFAQNAVVRVERMSPARLHWHPTLR